MTRLHDDDHIDVLVVDNDPSYAGMIATYLTQNGICSSEIWNGVDAIDAIRERKPSLVLMDVDMPGVDGIEVAKKLFSEGRPPRIILMSGYAECVRDALHSRLGVVAVIEKPVPLRILARSVRHWLSVHDFEAEEVH